MASVAGARDAALLLMAVRDLEPKIADLRVTIERERKLPSELVKSMAEAGFFSLWRARAFGGPELSFPDFVQVVEELSRADGSVGWCAMVGAVLSRLSGYLKQEVAREIFGDSSTIVAGSVNPSGKAVAVAGGYRVSGRWSYGSLVQHSRWTVGNSIVYEGDTPRRDEHGAPDIRFMIVPTRTVEILDNWYVSGLKGTGSNDFQFHDLFVPEDYALPAFNAKPLQPGTLYATPLVSIFAASIPAVSCGIARSAIDAFIALAESKTPMGSTAKLRDKPTVQADIGRAEALLRSGRAFLIETVGELWNSVAAGETPSMRQRAIVRLAAAHAAASAAQAVDLLHNAAGGSALFESNRLERCFRDVHATTQHIGTSSNNFELGGRVLLGLDPGTPRF